MIVRKWDWFIPSIPPRIAFIEARIIMNLGAEFDSMNDRMVKGASFCHVVKIMQESHDNEVITGGNQKWNGAIPNFSIMADIKMM